MPGYKSKWSFILGASVSLGCIVYAILKVDIDQLFVILKEVSPLSMCSAVFFILLTQIIRSMRWRILLLAVKPIGLMRLISATLIGSLADMILPARLGDIIRAGLIGKRENVSALASLATIVVERIYDILTIVFIMMVVTTLFRGVLDHELISQRLRLTGTIVSVGCFALLAMLFFIKNKCDRIIGIIDRYLRILPEKLRARLSMTLTSFASGLQTIQLNRQLPTIAVESILLWSAFAMSNYYVLKAMDHQLSLAAAYYILIFQVFGVTLPSSPGFIGTYHAAVVAGLSTLGISVEQALGTAIIMHAVFFFPFVLCGTACLWLENISIREIRSSEIV